jgi:hypothetical protein
MLAFDVSVHIHGPTLSAAAIPGGTRGVGGGVADLEPRRASVSLLAGASHLAEAQPVQSSATPRSRPGHLVQDVHHRVSSPWRESHRASMASRPKALFMMAPPFCSHAKEVRPCD